MISSNWLQIHAEIVKIQTHLLRNAYPDKLLDRITFSFMTKLQTVRRNNDTEDKKEFKIILPYLGKYSSKCEKKIKTALHKHLPNFKLTFVYRASTRLSSLFKFKDRIPQYLSADILYKFTCSKCNFAYIGETERHAKTRFCEHLAISALTGKTRKMPIPT